MAERSFKIRVSLMDRVMNGDNTGPEAIRAEKCLRQADGHKRKAARALVTHKAELEAESKAREQAEKILSGDENSDTQPVATEPGALPGVE